LKRRAVIEQSGRVVEVAAVDGDGIGWHLFCDRLREVLFFAGERDGVCTAAVVSLHHCDERCDHE